MRTERLLSALAVRDKLMAKAGCLFGEGGGCAGVVGALVVVVITRERGLQWCDVFGWNALGRGPAEAPTITLGSIIGKNKVWVKEGGGLFSPTQYKCKPLPKHRLKPRRPAPAPYTSQHVKAFETCTVICTKPRNSPPSTPSALHPTSLTPLSSATPRSLPSSPSPPPSPVAAPEPHKRRRKRKWLRPARKAAAGFQFEAEVQGRGAKNDLEFSSMSCGLADSVHDDPPPPGAGIDMVLKAAALTSGAPPYGLLTVLQDVAGPALPIFGVRGDRFNTQVSPRVPLASTLPPPATEPLACGPLPFPWACTQTCQQQPDYLRQVHATLSLSH